MKVTRASSRRTVVDSTSHASKDRSKERKTVNKGKEVEKTKEEEKTKEKEKTKSEEKTKEKEKEKEEEPQCGICFEAPTIRGKLDSCAHPYCFECINQWSKSANTCPFCKKRFNEITKLDPSAKRPKKIKVKHKDQRPPIIEPESWITFSGSSDDEYDEDSYPLNPFALMLPFLLPTYEEDFFEIMEDDDEDDFDTFDWEFPYVDLTEEGDESTFFDPVIISDSPEPPRTRTRTSVTRTEINLPRRSTRRVPVRTPVENQRSRTLARTTNARNNSRRGAREQNGSTNVASLGRGYRFFS